MSPQNANHKRRVRAYAADHALTYQQALHAMDAPPQTGHDGDGYDIGRCVTVTGPRFDRTYVPDVPMIWNPFSSNTSPCILMDHFAHSSWSAIAHVLATHPDQPAKRFLAVTGPICDGYPLLEQDETRWLAEQEFTEFHLGNEEIGYSQLRDATDAINAFAASADTVGVVLLSLSHPYPQVTNESNQVEFEKYWKGTASEKLWKPRPTTDGPYWCRAGEVVPLSPDEQSAYADYLAAIERLLRQSRSHRNAVFVCSDDNNDVIADVVDIFGVDPFGLRISTQLRLEYSNPPLLDGSRGYEDDLAKIMPMPTRALSASHAFGYWSAANPKQHRTVLAHLPGWDEAQMLLLKDPPEVPAYWNRTYESMCEFVGM